MLSKHGLSKHGLSKHGLSKHGPSKHGPSKHGLSKSAPVAGGGGPPAANVSPDFGPERRFGAIRGRRSGRATMGAWRCGHRFRIASQ
jgi:hypothetical protein